MKVQQKSLYEFEMEEEKTEVLLLTKAEEEFEIIIEGQIINISKNLKLQRAVLDNNCKTEIDVENRIKTTRLFHALKSVSLKKRKVYKQINVKIYKSVLYQL